jgi:hypothetical protein
MNKLFDFLVTIILVFITSVFPLFAQETQGDTIPPLVEKLTSDMSILNRLKVSGLVQAQWQMADTIGSPASASGGDFKNLDNRFQLRRARLKTAYKGEMTSVVLQLDLKDDGSVKVKEAYGAFSEPILNIFTLSGGYMNRPIAYEVGYSSSNIESPERARIIQTLFPDEVDMGAMLTVQAPKTHPLNFIKLEAGIFNGNALASDNDKYKDFISHLSFKTTLLNENMTLSGGISYYNGGYANQSGKVFSLDNKSFLQDAGYSKLDKVKRHYYGVDFQISLFSNVGLTTLHGEYLWGDQPGTKKSSASPKGAMTESKEIVVIDTAGNSFTVTATVPFDIYLRQFSGGYIMLAHRLMQTKHEVVLKYDFYDPNTKLSKNEIVNIGDLSYATIGIGYNYYATSNFKFTAYYEIVKNEKTSQITGKGTGIDNYSKDIKDNILTLRLQYKF